MNYKESEQFPGTPKTLKFREIEIDRAYNQIPRFERIIKDVTEDPSKSIYYLDYYFRRICSEEQKANPEFQKFVAKKVINRYKKAIKEFGTFDIVGAADRLTARVLGGYEWEDDMAKQPKYYIEGVDICDNKIAKNIIKEVLDEYKKTHTPEEYYNVVESMYSADNHIIIKSRKYLSAKEAGKEEYSGVYNSSFFAYYYHKTKAGFTYGTEWEYEFLETVSEYISAGWN